jgi:hypothetical protein
MAIYTLTQARRNLAALLDRALQDGEVRIRRRDGQVFVVRPQPPAGSPLDVFSVNLGLSAAEIVAFVRDGRRPPSE